MLILIQCVLSAQKQCMRAISGWASCGLSHSQSHHQTVSCHTTPHVSDILIWFFTAPRLFCRPRMSFFPTRFSQPHATREHPQSQSDRYLSKIHIFSPLQLVMYPSIFCFYFIPIFVPTIYIMKLQLLGAMGFNS